MIKAVIFDMDGVIVNSEKHHADLENRIFKELGLEISKEEHESFVGTGSYYMWGTLKEKYSIPFKVEELIKKNRDEFLEYVSKEGMIVPINGVENILKFIKDKGLKTAVASSSPLNFIEKVMDTIEVRDYFEELVTGDYVKRSKPEPDIFLYAAEKLGVKPEECIVIEDSRNGVIAAKKANMKAIGYKDENSRGQNLDKADIVIKSFNDNEIRDFIIDLI